MGDGLKHAGFTSLARRTDPQRDFHIRLDHTFNDNHNLFGRYSWGQQDTVGDTTNLGAARFPGLPPIVATFRAPKNLAIGLRSTLSPTTTNELVVGGNRFTFDFAVPSNQDERTTPIITVNFTDPLSNSFGNLRRLTTYQALDNITHVRGEHTFRAGVNFRLQQHYDVRGSVAGLDPNPSYFLGGAVDPTRFGVPRQCTAAITTSCANSNDRTRLTGFINDLLGKVDRYQVGLVAAGDTFAPPGTGFIFDAWYPEYDFYFQDDWKARPNLTLNLGLRWEPKPKPYTRGDSRIFVPDKPVVSSRRRPTTSPSSRATSTRAWNNFAPPSGRPGPFATGHGVRATSASLRRISTFLPSSAVFPNTRARPSLTSSAAARRPTCVLADGAPTQPCRRLHAPALTRAAYPGFGVQEIIDPDFTTPTTYMWSLGVQREIGWKMVVEAQYIGREGRNLIGGYERNMPDYFNNGFLQAFIAAKGGGESTLLNQLTALHPNRTATETGAAFLRRFFASSPTQQRRVSLAATSPHDRHPVGRHPHPCRRRGSAGSLSRPTRSSRHHLAGGYRSSTATPSRTTTAASSLMRRFERGCNSTCATPGRARWTNKSYDPTITRISSGTGQSARARPSTPPTAASTTAVGLRPHARPPGRRIYELPFGRASVGAPTQRHHLASHRRLDRHGPNSSMRAASPSRSFRARTTSQPFELARQQLPGTNFNDLSQRPTACRSSHAEERAQFTLRGRASWATPRTSSGCRSTSSWTPRSSSASAGRSRATSSSARKFSTCSTTSTSDSRPRASAS